MKKNGTVGELENKSNAKMRFKSLFLKKFKNNDKIEVQATQPSFISEDIISQINQALT